ncbi:helix-turn-helix domain-containing protein [Serinibacter salmoneus]|uniref:Excisionase family DNA binding protein n=1 Tax=Serinibacter salmoneus TaxID=556530 RepID=A0A2A9D0Y1_9MICO|nr:helix-turn-helix domain-containing protein [Serinibacter salmoneus]PFG20324.1 excisionase family DNA binding protein [Serinibacter salmoneus]
MPERMLTLADVAEVLDITVPTARALVRQGEIKGFQVGGRGMWRVESKELDAYIEREKAAATARREALHEN